MITLTRKPDGEYVAILWQDDDELATGTGDSAKEALGELGEAIDELREMCG